MKLTQESVRLAVPGFQLIVVHLPMIRKASMIRGVPASKTGSPAVISAADRELRTRNLDRALWVGDSESDGVMLRDGWIKLSEVTDGLSNTVFFGETFSALGALGQSDYNGHPQHVDHWYIWSRNLAQVNIESSEVVGSTAARINATQIADSDVNEKELSFGSFHAAGGANLAYSDGHVKFVTETIDSVVFSAMGTRNGSETVSD